MRKSTVLRTVSALCVVGVVCVGLAFHTGTGTLSQWGIYEISAICPLGALESLIASKTFVPPVLIALAIAVVATLLLGKAFCAWGCPVPLVKRLFGVERRASESKELEQPDESVELIDPDKPAKRGGLDDSRNWVLGGTLVSTAIFGFPVFCLVCPVGLSFATVIALWRLFQLNEMTLSLVVFPLILIVEVVVLRSWCHRFCPIGALLSLISRANRTLRPNSDASVCLKESKGQKCDACAKACPEGIDLHDLVRSQPMHECTKCRKCADACPVHAISFRSKHASKENNQ